jgi:hypothetical protein
MMSEIPPPKGPTNRPHVLVVFRPELILSLELHRGLQPGALVVVNAPEALGPL